ncbi:hypothetical protein QBC38DRAFT_477540 [Podospora fimiseda]|uniref:Uncharacterized protein n=1 Tax=Podospora fimiseda TaxID=252190 RepID=A0AAN7BQ83_9PEZI|nr:hypothetical protein QBC38DRAFT_477540 [Podospora fimiseda]
MIPQYENESNWLRESRSGEKGCLFLFFSECSCSVALLAVVLPVRIGFLCNESLDVDKRNISLLIFVCFLLLSSAFLLPPCDLVFGNIWPLQVKRVPCF